MTGLCFVFGRKTAGQGTSKRKAEEANSGMAIPTLKRARTQANPSASPVKAGTPKQPAPSSVGVTANRFHGPGIRPVYSSYLPITIPPPSFPVSFRFPPPGVARLRPPPSVTMRTQMAMQSRAMAVGSQQTVAMQSPGGVSVRSQKTMSVQSPSGMSMQSQVETVQWQGQSAPNTANMWQGRNIQQSQYSRGPMRHSAPPGQSGMSNMGTAAPRGPASYPGPQSGMDALRLITGLAKVIRNQNASQTPGSNPPTSSAAYGSGPTQYGGSRG